MTLYRRFGYFCVALLIWTTVVSQGSDADQEKKRQEFLRHPVFSANRNIPPPTKPPKAPEAPIVSQPVEPPPVPRGPEECGTSTYLGHYCFRWTSKSRWVLCVDKWKGCFNEEGSVPK